MRMWHVKFSVSTWHCIFSITICPVSSLLKKFSKIQKASSLQNSIFTWHCSPCITFCPVASAWSAAPEGFVLDLDLVLARPNMLCHDASPETYIDMSWHIDMYFWKSAHYEAQRRQWPYPAARTPCWNHAGVEPGNQEGPGCKDLGRLLVQIHLSVQFGTYGTNQTKEWTRGWKPASKKV